MRKTNILHERLEEVLKELLSIRKSLILGSSALTPLNYEEEQKKFFLSDSYNPVFHYATHDIQNLVPSITSMRQELLKLQLPKEVEEYLVEYTHSLESLNTLKHSIGSLNFSKYAADLISIPKDSFNKSLAQIPEMNFKKENNDALWDAKKIKRAFEHVLYEDYDIHSFEVVVNSFANFVISTGYNRISIGSKVKRREYNVKRLIAHEIESHTLQTHNIKENHNLLAEIASYKEALLYAEGLAVYNEFKSQTMNPETLKLYINRFKAVQMLDKSFREIFNELSRELTEGIAYVATYRVKRGMMYTENPGGFPRDALYLLGFSKVMEFLERKLPIETFYIARNPNFAIMLEEYGLLKPSQVLLPKFYKQNV